jgi:oligopeptide/dipeptide ABC transporter ATP-binding protein
MYAGRIIESASVDEIFAAPRHPCTIELLRCVPRLDRPASQQLQPIEGQPPDALNPPRGCLFHPRCPFAFDRCRREEPVLTPVGDNHASACWLNARG